MKSLREWNRRSAGVRPMRVTRTKSDVQAIRVDLFGRRVFETVGWERLWRLHCRICDTWFPGHRFHSAALNEAHAHAMAHRRAS